MALESIVVVESPGTRVAMPPSPTGVPSAAGGQDAEGDDPEHLEESRKPDCIGAGQLGPEPSNFKPVPSPAEAFLEDRRALPSWYSRSPSSRSAFLGSTERGFSAARSAPLDRSSPCSRASLVAMPRVRFVDGTTAAEPIANVLAKVPLRRSASAPELIATCDRTTRTFRTAIPTPYDCMTPQSSCGIRSSGPRPVERGDGGATCPPRRLPR